MCHSCLALSSKSLSHKYPTSIASLAFNHNGEYLAIASSYTYEEGEKDHPADAIFIHVTSVDDEHSLCKI